MRTFFVALRAALYATGFVFLWGWVALSVRTYDRSLGIALPAWTATLGIFFMVAGGALALLCVGVFVERGRGTPAPFDAPRQFVATGPYRYVRNPMYVGGLTLLTGFGLYERSVSILLLCLLFLLAAHLFVLFYEEPTLRRQFGATYERYCESVPRWIPGARHTRRDG
jgi:protein-S-isoprenylcysteine O-methyltransferase Ste14